MYALNIADLTTEPILALIFGDVITKDMVKAEPGRPDGMAVLLGCDDSRAQAIVDCIRLKLPKNKMRCYYSKTGKGWKRI